MAMTVSVCILSKNEVGKALSSGHRTRTGIVLLGRYLHSDFLYINSILTVIYVNKQASETD
jgi:hypothetical protein